MSVVATVKAKNRGVLFAQVYLDSTLAKLQDLDESSLLETLSEWLTNADEASLGNLVSTFVGPVLDVQGFVKGELSGNCIALFEDRNNAKMPSLCYVVDSHESLDQTVKGKNYAVSLVKALKKAGLRWGILTNGSIWRLYYAKEKAVFETFFQIDLRRVIEDSDKLEVALFSHFFNVQSFMLDDKGKCTLDRFRQESEDATREIEEHLQSKMEDILGKICMGFIRSEGKKSYTEAEKRAVFNNSIYLLYRLLFILYAEARGFLPVQNSEYYEKSITMIMELVRKNRTKGIENSRGQTLWNILCELFNWVNQGNRVLGIPPYNGGLFDNSEKPYLANHAINDAFLSDALFSLGFREERGNIVQINYNDLSIRHLGGLYEGILEYQLFIAPERMVRRKQENLYKFIPEHLAGKIARNDTVIEEGEVYFSQSNEERKLTGSYYTPEYIVRYIVENSLQQYLIKIDEDLKALLNKLIEAHENAIDDRERNTIEKFIDSEILSFLKNRILSIRVLDPAMGSGHFLVNVAHYLADYMVESLFSTEWTNEMIDLNPLWWRRQIVEKCIFGVDINELATELAKLSLWLISADNKKPLTFLDHHLRTGNSLLGAKLEDLGTLPQNGKIVNSKKVETNLYYPSFRKEYIPTVLRLIKEMDFSSEQIEDVERKKAKYKEWVDLKQNLQIVADMWLSTFFGCQISEEKYQSFLCRAFEGNTVFDPRVEESAGVPNLFFHWWLEFPEIFFKLSDEMRSGFDIVLGNPPYGLKGDNLFLETYSLNSKDSYGLFVKKGIDLLREDGIFSMLISDTWRTLKSHLNLRQFMLEKTCIKCLLKLNRHAFKEVDAPSGTVILELRKCIDPNERESNQYFFFDFRQIHPEKERGFFVELMDNAYHNLRKDPWRFDPKRAGRYLTRQGCISLYEELPIFDGSEQIYDLVSEKSPTKIIEYNNKSITVHEIAMPSSIVQVLSFSIVADVKQGLATGDNKGYLFKREGAIGAYRLVDDTKVLLSSQYEKLTESDKLDGISSPELRFEGRFVVPYDKGGESDIETGRLSCYYVPSQYFIDWSTTAVSRMKTLTIAERKRIDGEIDIKSSDNRICARFQNSNFYFKEGITFSMTGQYSPTFRLNSKSVFDVAGTSIFSEIFDAYFLLGILNSKLAKYFIKAFFMNTVNTHVGAINPLPLAIPPKEIESKIRMLVAQIIQKQKQKPDYEYQKNEQIQIDQLVYELYGLDTDLRNEVENWYARRYPKISGINIMEEGEG